MFSEIFFCVNVFLYNFVELCMCTAPNSIAETDNGIIMKITSILLAGMSFAAILSCNGNTRADNASGGGGKPTNDTAFNATDVETELYSYANSVIPSQYYSVKVNGHDATVIPGIAAPEGNQPGEPQHHGLRNTGRRHRISVYVII